MLYVKMMRKLHNSRTFVENPTEEDLSEAFAQLFVGEPHSQRALEIRWRLNSPNDRVVQPMGVMRVVKQLREYYPDKKDPYLAGWLTCGERRIKRALQNPSPLRSLFQKQKPLE